MRSFIPIMLCMGGLALGQAPGGETGKAPPEVDAALRDRVKLFYQAHVDGKPRIADQVVAEDSKDAFFDIEKPRFYSFEIAGITYLDNFTRARVTVNCEQDVSMPPVGRVKMKLPRTTTWKLVDGKWFWYMDPNAGMESPFGMMRSGPPASTGQQIAAGPQPAVRLEDLPKLVRADRTEVRLTNGVPERVKITNLMPGGVKLKLQAAKVLGFAAGLDRTELVQNQSAVLTLQYHGKAAKLPDGVAVYVDIEPTGQQIPIKVHFPSRAAK